MDALINSTEIRGRIEKFVVKYTRVSIRFPPVTIGFCQKNRKKHLDAADILLPVMILIILQVFYSLGCATTNTSCKRVGPGIASGTDTEVKKIYNTHHMGTCER